ncbi:hypothetical protein [Sphingomonas sp.]|nr:hypothetical protein [Sphingomonas sp.]
MSRDDADIIASSGRTGIVGRQADDPAAAPIPAWCAMPHDAKTAW